MSHWCGGDITALGRLMSTGQSVPSWSMETSAVFQTNSVLALPVTHHLLIKKPSSSSHSCSSEHPGLPHVRERRATACAVTFSDSATTRGPASLREKKIRVGF
ncbi:hypothetical protein SKAU_G00119600 [Synaphobranchus kaupii]|uniref:Uncharacterized protein n=1 Tax=Synaphobranchus kaupii TaxID=118154 RepID=A0A9Q1FNI4_SYNKA|nr:hypothetical protein SKAU_G00119600 [Synaphobranchus kaupii]